MRLLVVSHSCATPINQQVYACIQRLTGWELTIGVPDRWRDEFGNVLTAVPWPSGNLRVLSVPVWGNGNIILHTYRTSWAELIRREAFTAVYVNHEPYALATAQIAWACKRVGRLPMGFYSCQNIFKRYPIPFRWLEQMVYRQSRFAFPITDAVADVLRTKGFSGETAVCPLSFDPELYRPRPETEWPEEVKRTNDEVMLGFVGRLVEAKGLITLAESLCRLRDLRWRFVLLGAGPIEARFCEILRMGQVLDRIIRVGYVSHVDTPRYLAAMDILVLPSETQQNWKEQFGRVIPEALACGAAVVGSDSGEIPNLIQRSAGGVVFPERNVDALSAALRQMIINADKRRECALMGRRWALDEVAQDKVAERMAAVIERAALASS